MFGYAIKASESLKYFKPVLSVLLINVWVFAPYGSLGHQENLSISGWWFNRLNNEFSISDLEPEIISILYGWSGICGQFKLCNFVLFLQHHQC